MIRLISTVVLAFTAFTAQAAQEHMEFKTAQDCQAVFTGFHTQTKELGLTRYDHQGQAYFVKDGYVGYWSAGNGCDQAAKLTMEPVAEFKARSRQTLAIAKLPAAKYSSPFLSSDAASFQSRSAF